MLALEELGLDGAALGVVGPWAEAVTVGLGEGRSGALPSQLLGERFEPLRQACLARAGVIRQEASFG